MRVTAEADFTAVIHGGQLLEVKRGDVLKGDVATYLLRSGAPVAADEVDEQEATEQTEGSETSGEVEDPEESDELNIDGKIVDVLAWVGDDPSRATEARVAEEAKDEPRPRLLSKLAELEA